MKSVREVAIGEIALDHKGRLVVAPNLADNEDLELIYRAAMEISWSAKARALRSPELRPNGWSYADWFRQILRAADVEYGLKLTISSNTRWSVPEEVRAEIQNTNP